MKEVRTDMMKEVCTRPSTPLQAQLLGSLSAVLWWPTSSWKQLLVSPDIQLSCLV
jgi:hypothetical protein